MSRVKRIMKELEDTKLDTKSGVTLKLKDESDLSQLTGTFLGPPDSPYEGGRFVIDIEVPSEYPFKPPKMKFVTKVYHPNISSATGAICLDILKTAWTPILTLKSTLISLQALLQSPEPNDPQDAVVAQAYLADKSQYEKTAQQWTKQYAQPDGADTIRDEFEGIEPKAVQMFTNMGFDQKKVVTVLKQNKISKAADLNEELQDRVIQSLV